MCNRLPAWPQNFGRSSDCESSVAVRVGHERRLNQAQLVAAQQKPFTEAKAVLSGQMATMRATHHHMLPIRLEVQVWTA